jgi:hypothetical protein
MAIGRNDDQGPNFDDYFIQHQFKNMLHSIVIESFIKIIDGVKQATLCEHQELVENILLQGFPKEISKRIDNKRQVVNSIKISKIKLVSEAALVSSICFLLETNAVAGFVWGKLDEETYQYGCSLLRKKDFCIECLINPFVYYTPNPSRHIGPFTPPHQDFGWFIFQIPKYIFSIFFIYDKKYEIKTFFKETGWILFGKKRWESKLKQSEYLYNMGTEENYLKIIKTLHPYKDKIIYPDKDDVEYKVDFWCTRSEIAIEIVKAIKGNNYSQAYKVVKNNDDVYKLSNMKEFKALKVKFQANLKETEELFPNGGSERYQKIDNLMRPFHGTQELSKPEWWTKRAENASKIISFIKNKQYGQAYKIVHNNPDLKLIETIEFKKIQQFREKVIAKCETLFKQFKKENWQKIIKYMKSFLGSPNYDGKPEWWTERAKCRINIYNYIQTKDYGRMYSVLIENDPKYQLRELPEITSIIQSYPPFMKQAQKQNPFNFLMLKMWHFSHADPLSLKEFQNALEDYGKKHFSYGIQTIDALLAQAMVHQRAKAGTLQTLNQPLQKWIDTYCNKNNISECTRLCEGFKKLKCFDLERKLLESMVAAYIATDAQVKRLQSLQTGRHKPEVKTKTTKADLHFDMAAVNWSADQIKTFFETLAREDKTLNHGLVITRWQKNIQLSKDMWNLSQAETILSTAVTEQLGDMADFILVNAALMTPRGDRSKTGWLLKPSGVPPYDFIEIGLLIFGDVLGNGLNLQVYSVYLPDNELPSGNITELNKATSNLVIAVKNEEDPDVNGFVEAGREIILQALAGWLHTAKAQTANSDSEGNEDDSIF